MAFAIVVKDMGHRPCFILEESRGRVGYLTRILERGPSDKGRRAEGH